LATLRRVLVGFLAAVGLLSLLLAGAVAAGAAWLGRAPPLPDRVLLVADLREDLPEATPTGGLAALRLDRRLTVADAVLALDAAARDPRVAGLLARVDEDVGGLAVAQELRQAVGRLRAAGRFAVAHADTFGELGPGNEGYYLAASFERVELQPAGLVGLTGVAAEVPSLGRFLADLGVGFEVERRERYKTAAEPFTEAEISPANREMLEAVVGRISGQLAEGIAGDRRLEPGAAAALLGGGPYAAGEARAARLVDEVRHYDEARGAALARTGGGAEAVPLEAYWRAVRPDPGEAGEDGATRVALVRGVGTIRRGDGGLGREIAADELAGALADAVEDRGIRAVLLRLDTGGGSAVASETVARQVRRAVAAGKPVVVSMGNAAASGGYWIAAEASRIVAQPATLTGSIGVVAGKPVLAGLWERLGVGWAQVGGEGNAGMWSVNRPFPPEARARVSALVDAVYTDFKDHVARGRKLDRARVDEIAQGRVWTGEEAVALGLADRLGGLHEAQAAVREALGLPADAPLALEPLPAPRSTLSRVADLFDGGLDVAVGWREIAAHLLGAAGPLVATPVTIR
jgi:protease IV